MAKKSIVYRNKKRLKTIKRFAERREELKEQIRLVQKKIVEDEAFEQFSELETLYKKLRAQPRDASRCRYRERCELTGRGKGVYRFKIGRNKLRELAMLGMIPGLKKSSW